MCVCVLSDSSTNQLSVRKDSGWRKKERKKAANRKFCSLGSDPLSSKWSEPL